MQPYARPFRVAAIVDPRRERGPYPPLRGMGEIRRRAAAACGHAVVRRSWVVFVAMPNAPFALAGIEAALFARAPAGWKLWFHYPPLA
jgi:hypothetical protein